VIYRIILYITVLYCKDSHENGNSFITKYEKFRRRTCKKEKSSQMSIKVKVMRACILLFILLAFSCTKNKDFSGLLFYSKLDEIGYINLENKEVFSLMMDTSSAIIRQIEKFGDNLLYVSNNVHTGQDEIKLLNISTKKYSFVTIGFSPVVISENRFFFLRAQDKDSISVYSYDNENENELMDFRGNLYKSKMARIDSNVMLIDTGENFIEFDYNLMTQLTWGNSEMKLEFTDYSKGNIFFYDPLQDEIVVTNRKKKDVRELLQTKGFMFYDEVTESIFYVERVFKFFPNLGESGQIMNYNTNTGEISFVYDRFWFSSGFILYDSTN